MNKKKIIVRTVVAVLVVGLLIYAILSAVEYFRPKYVTVAVRFSDEPYTPELPLAGVIVMLSRTDSEEQT